MSAVSFSGADLRRLRGAVAFSRPRLFFAPMARILRRESLAAAAAAGSSEKKREKVLLVAMLLLGLVYLAMNDYLPGISNDVAMDREAKVQQMIGGPLTP